MTKQEGITILSEELQVTEAVIAYCRDFGKEGDEPPSRRIKRMEALRMAVRALEGTPEPAGDDAYRDALEKIRSLEAYNAQIRWERDIALQQLEEIGISLGETMDSVKEAVKKQYRTEYRPYRCPCCSHAWLEDSDATDYPEYCPGCGEPLHPEEEE